MGGGTARAPQREENGRKKQIEFNGGRRQSIQVKFFEEERELIDGMSWRMKSINERHDEMNVTRPQAVAR